MTERELIIVKHILSSLKSMDGGQAGEKLLHASVNLLIRPNALVSEFTTALNACEENRWINGIRPRIGAVKWNLTDLGQAALLEM